MLNWTAHFSLRELHLENKKIKKLALSKQSDMRNHMQMAEVREGAPGIRGTMWGAWIPWKNWKAVTVSLQVGSRRRPPAAGRFCADKKIKTHKLLSLHRSVTQDLRSIMIHWFDILISFDFKFITWMCHCVWDWHCLSSYLLSLSIDCSLASPPTATVTRRRRHIYQLIGIPNMWARSAVGKAQGLVSQGYGFDPDLFHKACYMPFTCRWRFEIKLGIFLLQLLLTPPSQGPAVHVLPL